MRSDHCSEAGWHLQLPACCNKRSLSDSKLHRTTANSVSTWFEATSLLQRLCTGTPRSPLRVAQNCNATACSSFHCHDYPALRLRVLEALRCFAGRTAGTSAYGRRQHEQPTGQKRPSQERGCGHRSCPSNHTGKGPLGGGRSPQEASVRWQGPGQQRRL